MFRALLLSSILIGSLAARGAVTDASHADRLAFDPNKYSVKTSTVDNRIITYRAYEGIIYVANPVDAKYQSMNFYVPSEYFEGKSIGPFNSETAPIFLPNSVGGYMPGTPGRPGGNGPGMPPGGPGNPGIPNENRPIRPDAIAVALSKGYVVAAPGARGRTLKDADGLFSGKAPACIVDLKAAVRYLRHNDKIMPGDAEKIISNGTSAGGALSALLGATGNSADYEPYLKAIGAASERDGIFAASCYCPITNLDHADTAYEWLFNGINTYDQHGKNGTMDAGQIKVSNQLKPLFPAYLNSLELRKADGAALTLNTDGEGSFKDYVKSFVIASAQKALKRGDDLTGLTWITVKNGAVTDIDFERFVTYAKRMKTAPAFDALDLRSGENNLFGTATTDNQHFTPFGTENSSDHSRAEDAVVKMLNPMNYIGVKGVTTSRHWRIRHGAIDRDTSLAIPVILSTALENKGYEVDFAMPWAQGHGGDYDLSELFSWIEQICR